jgi:hypothetical protein
MVPLPQLASRLLLVVPLGLGLASAAGAQQPAPSQQYEFVLSSGLFTLPGEARSVDWAVLNNSPDSQRVRVTVYRVEMGSPKSIVWPGVLAVVVAPASTFHNSNSVGTAATMPRGSSYEVVVELNDRRVLPVVTIWSDRENTLVPGTRIGPRDFVDLRP